MSWITQSDCNLAINPIRWPSCNCTDSEAKQAQPRQSSSDFVGWCNIWDSIGWEHFDGVVSQQFEWKSERRSFMSAQKKPEKLKLESRTFVRAAVNLGAETVFWGTFSVQKIWKRKQKWSISNKYEHSFAPTCSSGWCRRSQGFIFCWSSVFRR